MKHRCLFLLLLSVLTSWQLNAQKWCPAGATWYISEAYPYYPTVGDPPTILYGYEKASYLKDTVIADVTCKEIADTGFYENFGQIQVNAPVFTYSSGDTVYVFKNGAFVSTFYFACHVGDILRVSTSYGFVNTYVDTVGVSVINGDSLRYYTFHIPDSLVNCFNRPDTAYTSGGKVMERFGYISFGVEGSPFGFGWSCMEWQAATWFHCYSDSSFGLYTADSTTGCEHFTTITGIHDIAAKFQIKVSPNPATTFCNLELNEANAIVSAFVYDITGREVMQLFTRKNVSNYTFDVSYLPKGLYFIKLTDEAGKTGIAKLVKD